MIDVTTNSSSELFLACPTLAEDLTKAAIKNYYEVLEQHSEEWLDDLFIPKTYGEFITQLDKWEDWGASRETICNKLIANIPADKRQMVEGKLKRLLDPGYPRTNEWEEIIPLYFTLDEEENPTYIEYETYFGLSFDRVGRNG